MKKTPSNFEMVDQFVLVKIKFSSTHLTEIFLNVTPTYRFINPIVTKVIFHLLRADLSCVYISSAAILIQVKLTLTISSIDLLKVKKRAFFCD